MERSLAGAPGIAMKSMGQHSEPTGVDEVVATPSLLVRANLEAHSYTESQVCQSRKNMQLRNTCGRRKQITSRGHQLTPKDGANTPSLDTPAKNDGWLQHRRLNFEGRGPPPRA